MATNIEKELQAYKKFLNELYDNNSMEFFTNGGKEYASVLLSVLYSKTQNSIKMFCEGLNPEIFKKESELYNTLIECVDRGVQVEILMESKEYIDNSPSTDILDKDNVSIRVINAENKEKIFKSLHTDRCNFSVFDGRMIRLETNPQEYKAVGSFNRTDWADALTSLFDEAFRNAEIITAA